MKAKYKYTLSGSRVVKGDQAEVIFNITTNKFLLSGNAWMSWSSATETGKIEISLSLISVKFEIEDFSPTAFAYIAGVIAQKDTVHGDANELYLEMLKVAKEFGESEDD